MKKIDIGVIVTTLIIVTISCSLAFFAARVVGNPKDINLVTKNVAITFTDTSSIASNETISPGWNNVKTFTITNNSKEDFSYNIILKGLVNTFESINTLQYKITSDTGYNMDNYLNVIKTETSKDVVLAYNITIPKNTIQSYQVEFNYVSTEEDQSGDMGKKLGGTLAIEASDGSPEIYDKLLADNPTIKIRTDFSTTLTETNVNTLYKAQEDNTDVYYFAGDARNNWVKFGGYYWRIIRTNSDGSIRLLYHGTSTDTTEAYIGTGCYTKNCEKGNINYLNYTDTNINEVIQNWYTSNLNSYSKYISKTAKYCSDKTIYSESGNSKFFSGYNRLIDNKTPTYNCENDNLIDTNAFSITADELFYAGGVVKNNSPSYYYSNSNQESSTGEKYWYTITPSNFLNGVYSHIFSVCGSAYPGHINGGDSVDETDRAIRPVISIKGDNTWKSGDGSAKHPYEIEDFTSLTDKVLSDNPTVETRTDFSTVYTDTNTSKIFKSNENNVPVYYFAGNAQNNWVKFGTWEEDTSIIVGKTSDKKEYNLFSSISECNTDSTYNTDCEKIILGTKGEDMYWRIIRTNSDGSIRLLYAGTSPSTTNAYIGLSKYTENTSGYLYAGYMYGTSGSIENNRTNENSSTIKTYVDAWYKSNLTSYTKYLSKSATYCSDRDLANTNLYGGDNVYSDTNGFGFAARDRLSTDFTPNYNCNNIKDAFSGSNMSAKLTYPIALMTADEIAFAGGKCHTETKSYFSQNSLDTNSTNYIRWWTMTPTHQTKTIKVKVYDVISISTYGNNVLNDDNDSDYLYAVRPVISIKENAIYKSGDGSAESPYEIVTE